MNNMFEVVVNKKMEIPATKTADVTSDAVDVSGYAGALFNIFYGNSGDTLSGTTKWDCKLQSCSTESGTYTDVADADVESNLSSQDNSFGLCDAPADDSQIYSLSYKGDHNWVKVVCTATGTHTYGTPLCIFVTLELPLSKTSEAKVDP